MKRNSFALLPFYTISYSATNSENSIKNNNNNSTKSNNNTNNSSKSNNDKKNNSKDDKNNSPAKALSRIVHRPGPETAPRRL